MRNGQKRKVQKGHVPTNQSIFHGIMIHSYTGMIQHQVKGKVMPLSSKLIGPKPKQQSKGKQAQINCTFG